MLLSFYGACVCITAWAWPRRWKNDLRLFPFILVQSGMLSWEWCSRTTSFILCILNDISMSFSCQILYVIIVSFKWFAEFEYPSILCEAQPWEVQWRTFSCMSFAFFSHPIKPFFFFVIHWLLLWLLHWSMLFILNFWFWLITSIWFVVLINPLWRAEFTFVMIISNFGRKINLVRCLPLIACVIWFIYLSMGNLQV